VLYEDKFGRMWHPDEVEELSPHEIEEMGFHVFSIRIMSEL